MTDLQKFMAAGAKLMHADRPDLWKSEEDALTVLARWLSDLNGEAIKVDDQLANSIGSGGFELIKYTDPGGEYEPGDYVQYSLIRQLVDVTFEANQEDSGLFDWTSYGEIFNVGDLGID